MSNNQPSGVIVKNGTTNKLTLWALTAANTYTQVVLGGVTVAKAASTANVTALTGTTTIDGVALVAGDLLLLKNQTTVSQNGVYKIAAGAWTKQGQPSDVFVSLGTLSAGLRFVLKSTNLYTACVGVYG